MEPLFVDIHSHAVPSGDDGVQSAAEGVAPCRDAAAHATSLLGRHGPEIEKLGWRFVEDATATLVASDGHRATRPARLDEAYELVKARVGEERALPLFDGSALGLASARAAAF